MQPVLNIWIDLMTACCGLLWFFFILWILFCLEAIQSVLLPIRLGYRVQLGKHCSFPANLFSLQSLSLQQLVSSTGKSQVRLCHRVSFPLLCKRQYVSWFTLGISSCAAWPRALVIPPVFRRGSLALLTTELWRGARKKTILSHGVTGMFYSKHSHVLTSFNNLNMKRRCNCHHFAVAGRNSMSWDCGMKGYWTTRE